MGYAQDADNILLTNEIKKYLYKNKRFAHRFYVGKYQHQYQCFADIGNLRDLRIIFTVPVADMGETEFTDSIPAQLLIRYLDIL